MNFFFLGISLPETTPWNGAASDRFQNWNRTRPFVHSWSCVTELSLIVAPISSRSESETKIFIMEDVDSAKLARMLRECAVFVERNDFHTAMYQVLSDLSTYVAKHQNNTANSKGREVQKANPLSAGISGIATAIGKLGIVEVDKGKASSTKNADRAKADLHELHSGGGSHDSGSVNSDHNRSFVPVRPGKLAFQRPSNPESALLASGWIAQQRRSKLRVVWKDILATLVEARKSTEETTLWIQREITNSSTGKRELEALHKIPIKWIQEVSYLDFYGDYRFSVKVFNISEEFVFRCADRGSAQDWVVTLRSVKEEYPRKQQELRDAAAAAANASTNAIQADAEVAASTDVPAFAISAAVKAASISDQGVRDGTEQTAPRMTVKEMQAIAHGAGVNTHGMERPDLERVVAKVLGAGIAKATDPSDKVHFEAAQRHEEAERQEQIRRSARSEATSPAVFSDAGVEEERRRQLDEVQAQRVTEARRKTAEEEEKRRQLEEMQSHRVAEARRKAAEEEEKRQAALLEEQRQQAVIAEERRIAEEQLKIVEEQRRQAAAAEEQRRRLAEQEHMRRQEEERLRAQQQYQQAQQQWQAQQAAQQQWQAQQAAAAAAHQRAQAAQAAQWQQWQQQQQKQQQQQQQQQQKQPAFPQQPQRPSEPPTTSADMKYTKMAEESKGGEAVTINAVKRSILTHWALQPPNLQHLRSISDLLLSIHSVFPPAFGVPGHDHFKKWTPISRQELIPAGTVADHEKLNKAVKKLRFFLHPDKLPRDLTEEQQFMCRMLWDVSSDAWEEFKKRHEELDWMQK